MNDGKEHEGNEPATRAELEDLAEATAKGFEAVDKRFDGIDQRLDKVEQRLGTIDNRLDKMDDHLNKMGSDQKDILKTVKSIDEQLKEHKTLPARIARLESSVFR